MCGVSSVAWQGVCEQVCYIYVGEMIIKRRGTTREMRAAGEPRNGRPKTSSTPTQRGRRGRKTEKKREKEGERREKKREKKENTRQRERL